MPLKIIKSVKKEFFNFFLFKAKIHESKIFVDLLQPSKRKNYEIVVEIITKCSPKMIASGNMQCLF